MALRPQLFGPTRQSLNGLVCVDFLRASRSTKLEPDLREASWFIWRQNGCIFLERLHSRPSSNTMSKLNFLHACKQDLIGIYQSAIQSIRPETLIKNAVTITDSTLTIKGPVGKLESVALDLKDSNIHVIGGGKSVLAMALGLAELVAQAQLRLSFSHGLLSVPKGLEMSHTRNPNEQHLLAQLGIKCHFGSKNNLPDSDSVMASSAILRQIKEACDQDRCQDRRSIFIVLISGGGSACLTSPKYIDLAAKLDMIKYLVQGGADIVELNKVRRCFSHIKGGRLASFISENQPNSRVVSLILSDVIGDPLEHIASGPTVIQTGVDINEEMAHILRKYSYPGVEKICSRISVQLKPEVALQQSNVYNLLIGNNEIALGAAMSEANRLGYRVVYLGNQVQGRSEKVIEKILSESRKHRGEKVLTICGGEATIERHPGETWGQGGRAQEMALDYIIAKLKEKTFKENCSEAIDVFLAGTTDGQDGPTDVAACLASYSEYINDGSSKFTLEDAIKAKKSHDSYNFWASKKPHWLYKTGLTGTNVMDLYMHLERNKCLSKL